MLNINVPLYSIRHRAIGGTEFAIYNLVKGLYQSGANLTLSAGSAADLSPEFLEWMAAHDLHLEERWPIAQKNARFFQESMHEWLSPAVDWRIYPNYFLPIPRRPQKSNAAVIVHDVQYKSLPEYHSSLRRQWLDFYLPKMLKSSERVILISESERKLVYQYFGTSFEAKTRVVWNAIDWGRFEKKVADTGGSNLLKRNYLLSVCHQFPHKNLTTLLRAFALISEHDSDIELFLIGTPSAANKDFVTKHVSQKVAAKISFLGFVSDQALGEYYRNASVFVLPSLYEGFGMPAVEALGLGASTVVSGTSALPEVTLGLANYVANPLDVDEWVFAISSALYSDKTPTLEQRNKIRETFSPLAIGRTFQRLLVD